MYIRQRWQKIMKCISFTKISRKRFEDIAIAVRETLLKIKRDILQKSNIFLSGERY
jgi:hypothetical protein